MVLPEHGAHTIREPTVLARDVQVHAQMTAVHAPGKGYPANSYPCTLCVNSQLCASNSSGVPANVTVPAGSGAPGLAALEALKAARKVVGAAGGAGPVACTAAGAVHHLALPRPAKPAVKMMIYHA